MSLNSKSSQQLRLATLAPFLSCEGHIYILALESEEK